MSHLYGVLSGQVPTCGPAARLAPSPSSQSSSPSRSPWSRTLCEQYKSDGVSLPHCYCYVVRSTGASGCELWLELSATTAFLSEVKCWDGEALQLNTDPGNYNHRRGLHEIAAHRLPTVCPYSASMPGQGRRAIKPILLPPDCAPYPLQYRKHSGGPLVRLVLLLVSCSQSLICDMAAQRRIGGYIS